MTAPASAPDSAPDRAPASAPGDTGWLTRGERGALLGIRLVFWMARVLGRWPTRQFVRLLALYYATFDAAAARASHDWLTRVHGRPATRAETRAHILRFAQVALDRIYLLQGATHGFRVTRTGSHHLEGLVARRQGAVLLGAHLGSFEAMRAGAREETLPLYIVGHFENARMINALLARIAPEMAGRVIHAGGDPVAFALRIRELVEGGALVAILGDRVGLNDKAIEVPFLGQPARFPTGPFLLAAILRCPVYLVFGLYFDPDRYDLYCEPFAERVELPRGHREEALRAIVERYAERLEAHARKAPDNWFNFYDFWGTDPR